MYDISTYGDYVLSPKARLLCILKRLEEFALFFGEFCRSINEYANNVGTAGVASEVRNAVAAELEVGATLCTSGDFHGNDAVDCFDINFGTKGSVDHIDMLFAQDKISLTSEFFVRLHPNMNV